MTRTAEELAAQREAIAAFVSEPWLAHRMFFSHRMPDGEAAFHKDICDISGSGTVETNPRLSRLRKVDDRRKQHRTPRVLSEVQKPHRHRVERNPRRGKDRVVAYQLAQNDQLLMFWRAATPRQYVDDNETHSSQRILHPGARSRPGYTRAEASGLAAGLRGLSTISRTRKRCGTPEARRQTLQWFLGELLPACEPNARVLVNGTVLDRKACRCC